MPLAKDRRALARSDGAARVDEARGDPITGEGGEGSRLRAARASAHSREGGNVSDPQPDTAEEEFGGRPSASGHRFGPDLTCSECGVTWEEHQRQPTACEPHDDAPVAGSDAAS